MIDFINFFEPQIIIRGSVRPFGIPNFLCNRWWKDSAIPEKGEALLFTGLMYQFVPYIDQSTRYLEKFEDTPWADFLRYGKYVPNYLAGMGLALLTPGKAKKRFNTILQTSTMPLMFRFFCREFPGVWRIAWIHN